MRKLLLIFFTVAFLLPLMVAQAEKFYPDDPIWKDPDQLPVLMPTPLVQSELFDLVINTFGDPAGKEKESAKNANTLGEVPDSSWFTNRIGTGKMTLAEILQGTNTRSGPDTSAPLTIIKAKSQGVQFGFTVRDARGDAYFIKFDPRHYPELTTGAEVISTKFFYAFGFNVPENYLTYFNPKNLVIAPDAQVTDLNGRKRHMKQMDLDNMLKQVHINEDGTVRAIASLQIFGQPVGSFKYYGVRKDDANDIIPHQDRRELRGMRVLSSWLNDFDRRYVNSLDVYLKQDSQGYVKHYLLDFGSTLGSRGLEPQFKRYGHEYFLEFPPAIKSALTLGIWDRSWRYIPYPDYPSVGRIESKYYSPDLWKPGYPNPAFDRMQTSDAFWAAKIIARFTDDIVRAIVESGHISDAEASEYLIKTLIERRNKTIRYHYGKINPLDEFRVAGDQLEFKNLGVETGLAPGSKYQYRWFRFHNDTQATDAMAETQTTNATAIPLPDQSADYLMAEIQTLQETYPDWKKKIDVYIRTKDGAVVGIERQN
jgi:hypothetical protein